MPHVVELIVPPGKKKERLDVYITGHVENATRNKVQQAIRGGTVLVNGDRVRPSYTVMPDDVIQITLPRPPPADALPENIPVEILFEDDDLIVVNKPAGMVTHPAYGNYTGTLVNALLYHCGTLGAGGDPVRPGIVHRLDKDTSGVMVVAKNETAHAKLAVQFARRTIRREYNAVVWGRFRGSTGLIEAGLGRSKSDRKKMAVVDGGKSAATEYTVLEQFAYLALLRLKLRTGRTHQIRVHLAHINHPVFGDPTYNGRHIVWGGGGGGQKAQVQRLLALMPRQALHAKTLGFLHPATRREMYFETALPEDMAALLAVLESAPSPA
ncbi:MAG TPA: RluA family pseudouridine synthase [Bacteroidota bacterium]|nr:RluA family pseudouridine synthase [Bacteroidota bacterium]